MEIKRYMRLFKKIEKMTLLGRENKKQKKGEKLANFKKPANPYK